MKTLRPMAGDPLLQAAFGKPATRVLPENSPEYIRTCRIASEHIPIASTIQWEPGLIPGSRPANFAHGPQRENNGPNIRILDGENPENAVRQWLNK